MFGDVWRVELDTRFIISDAASAGILLEGGDGHDDFSGGAEMTIFSGGDGADRVMYSRL